MVMTYVYHRILTNNYIRRFVDEAFDFQHCIHDARSLRSRTVFFDDVDRWRPARRRKLSELTPRRRSNVDNDHLHLTFVSGLIGPKILLDPCFAAESENLRHYSCSKTSHIMFDEINRTTFFRYSFTNDYRNVKSYHCTTRSNAIRWNLSYNKCVICITDTINYNKFICN